MKQIWTVNYGGKRIDFGTLKEVRAFEHGLRVCNFKESVEYEIRKELDKTKKYLEWTSNLELLEYFRGKQKAYGDVLIWMK